MQVEVKEKHLQKNISSENDRVVLNVGGIRYEVIIKTLTSYPSLFSKIFDSSTEEFQKYKPDQKGEYFFDRNGRLFEIILDFFRTGILVPPPEMPKDLIKEELEFFQIDFEDEDEDEDERISKLPKEKIFDYCLDLIHRDNNSEIRKGTYYLKNLIDEDLENQQYLYYLAYALYRLSQPTEAESYLKMLIDINPDHNEAKSLLVLVHDSRNVKKKIGMFGFGLAFVITIAFGITKLSHRKRL